MIAGKGYLSELSCGYSLAADWHCLEVPSSAFSLRLLWILRPDSYFKHTSGGLSPVILRRFHLLCSHVASGQIWASVTVDLHLQWGSSHTRLLPGPETPDLPKYQTMGPAEPELSRFTALCGPIPVPEPQLSPLPGGPRVNITWT